MLAARPNKLVKIGVWLNVIACGLSVLGCMIDAQILQQCLLIISVAFLFSGAVICLIGIVYPPECWKRRKQSEEKEVGTNQ